MAIFRIEKTKNYTVMSNYHLREKDMSLKAKGLLSLMLSLPENWDYSINGLVAICKENQTAIESALKELKDFGYLKIVKKMPSETQSGRIEYEYIIYEQAQDTEKQALEEQDLEKQGVENLPLEIQGLENQGQINKDNTITKKINKDNKITDNNNIFDFYDENEINNEIIVDFAVKNCKGKNAKEQIASIINYYADFVKYTMSGYEDNSQEIKSLLNDWVEVRKTKRASNTVRAIELNLRKLDKLACESRMEMSEYLKEIICKGWQAFYHINNFEDVKNKNERDIAVANLMKNLEIS